jgi:pimeloyl-ACP methyl ester carboxylesterase
MPAAGKGQVPLQIMAGGWCYTKEIVMPHYARFFQDAGVATLLFDYRRFGESAGAPRQHIDPWDQIEDYRNALSFAETLPGVDPDRLGVWGISYSGGHVLCVAGTDPRVRWAISTIPVVDGFPTVRRCHGERRFADLMGLIAADRKKRYETGGPGDYMPMSSLKPGDELSAWPFPHVCEIFNDIKKTEAPNHQHYNTVESVELLLAYDVKPFCARIVDTPVLMTVAKGDNITSADLEITAFNAIATPNKTAAIVDGVSHMSLYSNRDHLAKVGALQSSWLTAELGK